MASILIPVLGFDRTGGYRVLAELANAWIRGGHAVAFLSPDSSDEPYFPTAAAVLWVDGSGTVSATRRVAARGSARYQSAALLRGLNRIGQRYDVVLANHSLTAWPVAFASCGRAAKFYYVQAYEPEFYTVRRTTKAYVLAVLSALSYHLPLRRIVNADIYRRYKNLRARDVIPPGIDLEVFKPSDARPAIEKSATVVLGCIGRREPQKGTAYALQAFESLYSYDRRFRLKVAFGNLPDGWSHEACEVVFPKNDSQLAEYYRSLDVLIAPGTIQHGAPHYPVLESWACGIPVVTTGYMGASNETAWLVRNRDPASIREAVLNLLQDPTDRRRRISNALELAQGYGWEHIAERMAALMLSGNVVAPHFRQESRG
jgi:glycosyltransferase involved in cell wall biosynthesis